jgi:exosome complex component RRP41
MATFSTGERKKKFKNDKKSTEISLVIRQTFESVIFTNLFPNTQIDIFMQGFFFLLILVLQADGGTRSACINAASLALLDAGIPMRDFVVSCSGGLLEKKPLLDMNFSEEGGGGPDLPIAYLPNSKKVSLVLCDSKISIEEFSEIIKYAEDGCKQIYKVLDTEIKRVSKGLIEKRGIINN